MFPDQSTITPVAEDQEIKEVLAPEDIDVTDTDTKADEVPEDLPGNTNLFTLTAIIQIYLYLLEITIELG